MSTYAYLFAVRDATLEPARAVRLANKLTCAGVVSNLIMHFRTRQAARLRARADRHRLHRRYRHHRLRQEPIEFQVPLRVRSQPRHDAARCDFEDPAQRVACSSRLVDQLDHFLLCVIVGTVQRRVIGYRSDLFPAQLEWRLGNAAKLNYMTSHFDTKHRQQLFCERATRYARGRLASRSTFEDVAQIPDVVLQTTRQIRVTWTRTFQTP